MRVPTLFASIESQAPTNRASGKFMHTRLIRFNPTLRAHSTAVVANHTEMLANPISIFINNAFRVSLTNGTRHGILKPRRRLAKGSRIELGPRSMFDAHVRILAILQEKSSGFDVSHTTQGHLKWLKVLSRAYKHRYPPCGGFCFTCVSRR
jgi:hypothetical protein